MNNTLKRILLAAIFIPAIIFVILFMPWYNHLVLNLLILGFAFLGSRELAQMFRTREIKIPSIVAGILGVLPAAVLYITATFPLPPWIAPLLLLGAPSILLTKAGLMRKSENIDYLILRLPAALSLLIYPGLFMAFLLRITLLPSPMAAILTFFTIVFCHDSFGYFAGSLFGKNNRGIFAVSPNKSLAGVLGGWGGGSLGGFFCTYIFPDFWLGPRWTILLLATGVCAFSVIGDLAESAFKRSAGIKDSGTLLQGRGGVLDSLDSLMFAAPLFYYWVAMLK